MIDLAQHTGCLLTRLINWLNILPRCLFTNQHLLVKRDICFQWKFNPEFNLLTQKIQITEARNFKKWLREDALSMTSLVLILAIFIQRR